MSNVRHFTTDIVDTFVRIPLDNFFNLDSDFHGFSATNIISSSLYGIDMILKSKM